MQKINHARGGDGKFKPVSEDLIDIRKEINSPLAYFQLLLEILVAAEAEKDFSLAFDVLWAIEDSKLYASSEAELLLKKKKKVFTAHVLMVLIDVNLIYYFPNSQQKWNYCSGTEKK